MDGLEEKFESYLLDTLIKFDKVNVVELGVSSGFTAASILDILEKYHRDWAYYGIDLPEGYDKEKHHIKNNLESRSYFKISHLTNRIIDTEQERNQARLLLKDSNKVFVENWKDPIHFLFLDGCHCYDHSKKDFETVEKFIAKDGLVLFHDIGEIEQGTDHQHDGFNIDVRRALKDLGLLDNQREGWEFVEEIWGDRHTGGWGNNIGVFKKL